MGSERENYQKNNPKYAGPVSNTHCRCLLQLYTGGPAIEVSAHETNMCSICDENITGRSAALANTANIYSDSFRGTTAANVRLTQIPKISKHVCCQQIYDIFRVIRRANYSRHTDAIHHRKKGGKHTILLSKELSKYRETKKNRRGGCMSRASERIADAQAVDERQ